jgi:ABC-2 type transport system ATP-binding protein
MPDIEVRDLRKTFVVPVREAGLRASVRSLVRREHREVRAVDGISFQIEPGEVVGFLGPNGAGKTTTLKMLSGLLYPTGGKLSVLDHVPSQRKPTFLEQITLVMGNRNQLQWDLPAVDSFEMNRAVFGLDRRDFRRTLDELVELLEIGEVVHKPVRQLSLGERMKVELAGGLLHQPRVLFLDEPTIGLDVAMQRRIRSFIAAYNRRHQATILLTSHYMADVQALCRRIIVIHHGAILFDGELRALSDRFTSHKTVNIALADPSVPLDGYGEVVAREGSRVTLRVPKEQTSLVAAKLLNDQPVSDVTIEDQPIEDVIEQVFASRQAPR